MVNKVLQCRQDDGCSATQAHMYISTSIMNLLQSSLSACSAHPANRVVETARCILHTSAFFTPPLSTQPQFCPKQPVSGPRGEANVH